MKKPNGKPTPKALALRRWHCESLEEMRQLIETAERVIVQEKWTQKYKSSINCSHPKGFSQKAHCAGKKKHEESMQVMEMTCPDCGMCQSHGNLSEIAKGAKDSNGYTKCWPGHHAAGTKKGKNGGQVRNCVPNESIDEAILSFMAKPLAQAVKKKTTSSLADIRAASQAEDLLPPPHIQMYLHRIRDAKQKGISPQFSASEYRELEQWAQKQKMQGNLPENFADGRHPEDKGDSKRHGINTKASVTSLRKTAKQGGRKGQLAHWLANMKAGRAKKD
jgi:hypothetical protein